jgi:hypothetical protein
MAEFDCPHCGHTQTVDDKHLGKVASCPKCKTKAEVVSSGLIAIPSPTITSNHSCVVRSVTGGPLGITSPNWMRTQLLINQKSSLKREHRCITDDSLPIRFAQVPVVSALNLSNDDNLHLIYQAQPSIECTRSGVRAFEVRYLLFNVLGDHIHSLTALETEDIASGHQYSYVHNWGPYSQPIMDEYYISLAYISRALLESGTVAECDEQYALREIRKVSERFTASDLTTKTSSNYR